MTKHYMKKRPYLAPCVRVRAIEMEPLMEGTTETLPFDQNDGTEEALSKEGSIWDDYVPRGGNDLFEE
jgi:hypothetical protein